MTRRKLPEMPAEVERAISIYQHEHGHKSWAFAALALIVEGLQSNGQDIELPDHNWGGWRGD